VYFLLPLYIAYEITVILKAVARFIIDKWKVDAILAGVSALTSLKTKITM
jgi:hypothetical protein